MNRNSAWAVVETEAIGADVTIAEFAGAAWCYDWQPGGHYPHVVIESGA
ncbi:hypothetical protein N2603_28155 [Bradyrhizobium huanghuaihaiense]|nr:hypothetical protein [Bradyrhizobium sp. CB3035]UWU73930.1 hypothetical protein N2603_28155 [Bradyrhizobium sp. CB3035]